MQRDSNPLSTFAVAVAAVAFGTVPYFAKALIDACMAPVSVAFYRYLLVGIVLLPFLQIRPTSRRPTLWTATAGAAMGIGWTGYVQAIESLPVSVASILYMTYPTFTVGIGLVLFGQRPTAGALIASLLIFIAAILVAPPILSGNWITAGIFYALAASLSFGLAVNILATKLQDIPAFSRVSAIGLGAVLGLAPLVSALPMEAVLPATPSQWWAVAGICLVTALVPQLLYVVHSPRVGPVRSAMLGGLELPTMILIGWLAFQEPIQATEILAAIFVVSAIAMTSASR